MSATYKNDNFISYDLARWVHGLTYEDLSPEAIEAAKLFWYDSIGCSLGGSQTEDAQILLEHYRAMHGENGGASTCFVSGYKTNPVDAALINSHLVRAMDFNDIYWKADPSHPSDLICGPLALVEASGLGGKELILATVIAYELEMRLVEIGRPGIREYGWHHATLSGFAAPFAAGKTLGLGAEQLVHALGISAARTGALGASTAGKLSMMKNTVDPWASRLGVESALLAQRGYTGPEHVIDGKEGLAHVFGHNVCAGGACGFDVEGLTRDLPGSPDDHYRILDCGMKSFPIEALSHAPLSAMMKIVKDHAVDPGRVREIRVEVIARAADILGDPHKYRPTSRETADHSLPYALAVGLVDGMVTPLQFEDSRVRDPKLIPIMDMVKVVPNADFESRFPEFQPSRVTIKLDDGAAHVQQVDVPKGDARDPMTAEEIKVKFDALGAGVIGQANCDALGELIMDLDNQASMDAFFGLIASG